MHDSGINIGELVQSLRAQGYTGQGDAIWRHAQRVLTHRIEQARASGREVDAATEQALRQALGDALDDTEDIKHPSEDRHKPSVERDAPRDVLPSAAHLQALVGAAFAAPIDGSHQRANVLAWRALKAVERALWRGRWWSPKAWRLRMQAYRAIKEARRAILNDKHLE